MKRSVRPVAIPSQPSTIHLNSRKSCVIQTQPQSWIRARKSNQCLLNQVYMFWEKHQMSFGAKNVAELVLMDDSPAGHAGQGAQWLPQLLTLTIEEWEGFFKQSSVDLLWKMTSAVKTKDPYSSLRKLLARDMRLCYCSLGEYRINHCISWRPRYQQREKLTLPYDWRIVQ